MQDMAVRKMRARRRGSWFGYWPIRRRRRSRNARYRCRCKCRCARTLIVPRRTRNNTAEVNKKCESDERKDNKDYDEHYPDYGHR